MSQQAKNLSRLITASYFHTWQLRYTWSPTLRELIADEIIEQVLWAFYAIMLQVQRQKELPATAILKLDFHEIRSLEKWPFFFANEKAKMSSRIPIVSFGL